MVDAVTDRPATPTGARPDAPGREIVISARQVGKRFMSGGVRATSLKERLVSRRHRHSKEGEAFWALRDVTTDIPAGQTVGLIGANGSGKSTLLKVLAGILRVSEGEVDVQGRIASLLELGAGFNGELTGRDNVYLNASLLGLTHAETDALFDSIVDFAELRHKIDDEVKHYSSGQYVRLGFAVAVHVDPDILLVDEVLAVGDEAFQRKCLARIQEFRRQGRTILFVSHSLELVETVCDRVLVLRNGELVFDGEPATGTELLREQLRGGRPLDAPAQQSPVQPTGVSFRAEDGPRAGGRGHEHRTRDETAHLHGPIVANRHLTSWEGMPPGGPGSRRAYQTISPTRFTSERPILTARPTQSTLQSTAPGAVKIHSPSTALTLQTAVRT